MTQEEDKVMIKNAFEALISGSPKCQTEEGYKLVKRAFDLANQAHANVKRKSGEPYIMHPIEVARIVSEEIGLGSTGVAAALLHDVIEDTEYTYEDLKEIFGEKVASIVEGLTKLSNVFDKTKSAQAENFRKLLLTMVDDIRIIIIKLADRLHNMRTLASMPEHKRLKIASETLFIYAPLALRLGLHAIKTELEDLSFKYEHPSIYKSIEERINIQQLQNEDEVVELITPIKEALDREGLEYEIKSRPKSVYSIYRKMQDKHVTLDEIYDLLAVRIVFKHTESMPDKAMCWHIYSLITDIYTPKPERLRDWVSTPKTNGYEALHTTVMGPRGRWVEIQIRSERMHEIAERGIAAHSKYKGDKGSEVDHWLQHVRDVLSNPSADSMEFLDDFKLNLFSSEINVFTPQGDLRVLPQNATVIDFAYDIHTGLGNKCIGAKVNSNLVAISHILKSGDQVEVLTSEKQKPQYDWLDFVVTSKARTNIKDAVRKDRKFFVEKGKRVFSEELAKRKLTITNRTLYKVKRYNDIQSTEDLYFRLGEGSLLLDDLDKMLITKRKNKWVKYWGFNFGGNKSKKEEGDEFFDEKFNDEEKSNSNSDDNSDSENYVIAKCCNPIPGDDVVGCMNDDNTIVIHKRNCNRAIEFMSSHGDKIVKADWVAQKMLSFLAIIKLNGIDRIGLVNQVTSVISDDQRVNIRSINFESHDGIFEGLIYLYIRNVSDLNNLIAQLALIKGVEKAVRIENMSDVE